MKPGYTLALIGFLSWTSSASGQVVPGKDVTDQAQTLNAPTVREETKTEAQAPSSGKANLVVAPIPVSNPALGTGAALAAVLFYNPNHASQPWISGVGGSYTDTNSWGIAAFHSMSAAHDGVRVLAFAGYGQINLNFYGIGPAAGSAGLSVEMHDKSFAGLLDGEVKLFKTGFLRHLFVGARFLYLDLDSRVDLPPIPLPNRPDLVPPPIELDSRISMIGPAFTFDSRNNSTNPSKGVYVTGSQLWGTKALGSDFSHDKLQFAANAYLPLDKDTVLGIRKQLCGVSDNAPYYDLCMFGQQGDLRGYETGRYRDGASWALQAEFRRHLFGRFGAVAFGGFGGIAEDTKAIWKHSTVLGSAGLGLRYLASKKANVNLRADVAWGKDGAAFYFGIGEAF